MCNISHWHWFTFVQLISARRSVRRVGGKGKEIPAVSCLAAWRPAERKAQASRQTSFVYYWLDAGHSGDGEGTQTHAQEIANDDVGWCLSSRCLCVCMAHFSTFLFFFFLLSFFVHIHHGALWFLPKITSISTQDIFDFIISSIIWFISVLKYF